MRCGHHYPIEGCHHCWEWVEEDLHVLRLALAYLVATGAVSHQQIEVALDEAERQIKTSGGEG